MRLEDQEEEVTEEKDVEEEPDSTGRENEEMKEEVANLHCGGHRGARDCSSKMEDKVPKKMEEEGDDEDEEQNGSRAVKMTGRGNFFVRKLNFTRVEFEFNIHFYFF